MDEAELKGQLVRMARLMMPNWVVQRNEDLFTHGLPDSSFTGLKRTTWIEAKYGKPYFKVKGIQEETMKKLAFAGYAFFVVYEERDEVRKTHIIEPEYIREPHLWTNSTNGFNHRFVLEFIYRLHKK